MENENETRERVSQWIERKGQFEFSRSGGPGGQNVNKVNTRATLRLEVASAPLMPEETERLGKRLSGRMTESGELVIHASETRSQLRNREIAKQRAEELIVGALRTQKKRRPTRPGKEATRRRLEEKRRRGARKSERRAPEL
ncbi:MAG: alternative ribosome rescue aminoacyl-tRNA hydrolase ArfB [Spirochaetota bacterium]